LKHRNAPPKIALGVALAAILGLISILTGPIAFGQGREPDKTLKLYFAHTGERGTFTFKKNGHYDPAVLAQINRFLRDWRADKETQMDPHLFDLVWAIYQASGSKDYIHVVSAYRSPSTNEMLRARTSGVAKNSQHRLGKAMDWFVTDVPLSKLRALAMKMQGGGVGYYPKSGSPFVHTDTGNVRAWPRMSRQQLIALFPKGNTLHLPASGPPLPGYEQAVARRKALGEAALAYLQPGEDTAVGQRSAPDSGTRTWLARVFPGTGKAEEAAAEEAAASQADNASIQTAAAESDDDEDTDAALADARLPRARPGEAIALASLEPGASPDAGPVIAEADEEALSMMVMPPLRSGEDYGIRPANGFNRGLTPNPPAPGGAQRAIAALVAPTDPQPPATVALAYSTTSDGAISDADRAILTAFATIDRSAEVRAPDPTLVAALTRRASAGGEKNAAVVVAATQDTRYDGDENTLLGMIRGSAAAPAAASGSAPAQIAMPQPSRASIFTAPAQAEVTALNGTASPPIDRFTPPKKPGGEQGFFTKLFASLVE
jgi:uncharacterized protein YcbK (DUF882 family)